MANKGQDAKYCASNVKHNELLRHILGTLGLGILGLKEL